MSKQVDSYVASMEFDNSRFEKNVSTTMSTLDKLKEKLNFSGASKGLEDFNTASNKCTMSGLSGAVDTIKAKFSALDVVAVTALANITNKAVDAGEKLIKSLSIDRITSGWQKYSEMTISSATLIAQGNALEDVNEQLERLLVFTDETSYSFTDMVSSISKFTAAGQDLEGSTTAMMGIANWAALSGQNATVASRAMTQLAQAMGSGVMKQQDWVSIENASMNTVEFEQACIDAAIALGTLRDNGDGTYSSLVDGASDAAWSLSQFRNSLTTGLWLNSDVMMSVFTTYSSAVQAICDAADESDRLISDIMDEIHDKADELKTDAMTDEEAIDAAIKELGYTLEDGSLAFDSFGLKAFEAAQKARTFDDAITSVKDAVATGWMKTFQILFGDAEKATELWTGLAETLWDVFAAGGEVRNKILESALGKSFSSLSETLSTIKKSVSSVGETLSTITEPIKTVTKTLEDYNNVVNEVIRGDWGHTQERWNALTEAGYDWITVQNMVNEKLGNSYRRQTDFVIGQDSITTATQETTEADNEYIATLTKLSDAELKALGLTDEQINAIKEVRKQADKLGMTVEDFLANIDELDGRWILINSFKNVWAGIVKVFEAVKAAWEEIFPPKTTEEKAEMLYDIIAAIHKFTTKLIMSDNTAEKVTRTFKGLFAILDVIRTIFSGGLRLAIKLVSKVLGALDMDVLDLTASIGDSLVNFRDWVLENNNVAKAIDKLIDKIPDLISKFRDWLETVKESEAFQKFSETVDNLVAKLPELVAKFQEWFATFKDSALVQKAVKVFNKLVTEIIPGLIKSFKDWFETFKNTSGVKKLIDAVEELIDAFRKLFNGEIDANEFARMLGDGLGKALSAIPEIAFTIGKDFIAGFQNGIGEGITEAIQKVITFCVNFISAFASALGVHSPSVIAYAIGAFFIAGFINGLVDNEGDLLATINSIGESISSVFKSFWGWLTDEAGNVDWDKIFIGGSLIGLGLLLNKLMDTIGKFGGTVQSINGVINAVQKTITKFANVLDAVALDLKANAVLKFVAAVAILVACIIAIAKLTTKEDIGKMWNAVTIVAALALIVVGMAAALSFFNKSAVSFDKASKKLNVTGISSTVIQLGVAMLAIAYAVKILGELSGSQAEQGLTAAGYILIGMMTFMIIMTKVSQYAKDVSGFGGMMLKVSAAMILAAIVMKIIGGLSATQIENGITFMAGFAVFVMCAGVVASLCKEHVNNFGLMMIKLTVAMGLMAIVCKLVAKLTAGELISGAAFAAAFIVFVKYLVKSTTIANDQKIAEISSLLLSLSVSLILMIAVCKLAAKLTPDEMAAGAIFLMAFTIFLKYLVKVLTVGNDTQIAKVTATILAVATAIAILAAVSALMGFLDIGHLAKGVGAVAILCAMMALMIHGLKDAKDVKGTLIALTVAIAVMAAAVAALVLIGKDNPEALTQAVIALVGLMGGLAILLKVISSMGNVNTSTVWTLVAMAVPLLAFAGIMVGLSFLDIGPECYLHLGVLLGAMAIMVLICKMISGLKVSTSSIWTLTAMAVPLVAFAAIMAGLSLLRIDSSIPQLGTLLVLMGLMAVLCKVIEKIDITASSIITLTAMAIPLLAFAAIMAGLSLLKVDACLGQLATLLGVMAIMALICKMVSALKVNLSSVWTLTAMAVPLLAFALVMAGLSLLNIDPCIPTLLTLAGVMVAMTLICKLVSAIKVDISAVLALTAMALPLAAFALVLAMMSNVQNAIVNATALVELAAVCAILLIPLSLIGSSIATALLGVVGLLAMAVPLVAFAGILLLMSNVQNAIVNATALVELAAVCTVLLIPLAAVGALIVPALLGVVALLAMAVPLIAFVGILAVMSNVENAATNAQVLANLATTITLLLIPLTIIGGLIGLAITGIIGLTAMAIPMLAFVGVLALMDGIQNATTNTMLLMSLMTTMADLLIKLSIVGPLAVVGIVAIDALVLTIAAVGTLAVAIGALLEKFPSIETFLNKGLPTLEMLATSLGTMIGNFIGGIGESLGDSLVKIGEDISAFMDELAKASESASAIKASSFDGIKQMMTVLLEIGGTSIGTGIMDKINSIFNSGEGSMETFQQNGVAFFNAMKAIGDASAQVNINEDTINTVISAASRLSDLQSVLPEEHWFDGKLNLSEFAEYISDFGTAMGDFGATAGNIDAGSVNTVINTAHSIKNLIQSLAGLDVSGVAAFTGIGTGWAGADGPPHDIAQAIADFSTQVGNIDTNRVSVAVSAATTLKTLIASLVGLDSSGVESFKPEVIGDKVKAYSEKVADIDTVTVTSSIDSISRLKSFIAGLSGLDSSGVENFKPESIGSAISSYATSISGVDLTMVSSSIASATNLKNFINSLVNTNTDGVAAFKQAIDDLSTVNIQAVVDAFSGATEQLTNVGADMINGIVNGMTSMKSNVEEAAIIIASTASDAIIANVSEYSKVGQSIVENLAGGIEDGKSNAESAASTVATAAKDALRDKYDSFYSAGSYLVDGFKNGISENSFKAAAKAKAMAEAAEQAARDALQINSPSKKFVQIGSGVPEGFAKGIAQNVSLLEAPVNSMADSIVDTTERELDKNSKELGDLKLEAIGLSDQAQKDGISSWDEGVEDTIGATIESFEDEANDSSNRRKLDEVKSNIIGLSDQAQKDGISSYESVSSDIIDTASTTADAISIAYGSTGEEVKKLQTYLEELDFSVGRFGIDGIVGPDTEGAIKAWQEFEGLDVTGVIDNTQWDRLYNSYKAATVKDALIGGLSKEAKKDGVSVYTAYNDHLSETVKKPLENAEEALIDDLSEDTMSLGERVVDILQNPLVYISNAADWVVDTFINDPINAIFNQGAEDGEELADAYTNGVGAGIDSALGTSEAGVGADINNLFSNLGSDGATSFLDSFAGDLDFSSIDMSSLTGSIDLSSFTDIGSDGATSFLDSFAGDLDFSSIDMSSLTSDIDLSSFTASGSEGGTNFGDGVVGGLKESETDVGNAAYNLGTVLLDRFNESINAHSPSREAAKSGKWFGEGLVVGINSMSSSVRQASEDIGQTALNATRSAMSSVLEALNTDIDSQPTIRPVLDLSDVKTGVDAIGGLFANTQSIGVNSNLTAINSNMSRRLQNESEVVSAIKDLRKDMANMGSNTSYTINGITYDDGSNITDAVKTIVRAARIERRV